MDFTTLNVANETRFSLHQIVQAHVSPCPPMSKAEEFFTWNMAFRHLVQIQGFSDFILKDKTYKDEARNVAQVKYGGDLRKLTDKDIKRITETYRDADNIMRLLQGMNRKPLMPSTHPLMPLRSMQPRQRCV